MATVDKRYPTKRTHPNPRERFKARREYRKIQKAEEAGRGIKYGFPVTGRIIDSGF